MRTVHKATSDLEGYPIPKPIPRLSQTPGEIARLAPQLGEHTEEILHILNENEDVA